MVHIKGMSLYASLSFNGLIQDIPGDSVTTYFWPEYSARMTIDTLHDFMRLPIRQLEILDDFPEDDALRTYVHTADIVHYSVIRAYNVRNVYIYKCPLQYLDANESGLHSMKWLVNKPISSFTMESHIALQRLWMYSREWPLRDLGYAGSLGGSMNSLSNAFKMLDIRNLKLQFTEEVDNENVKDVLSDMTLAKLDTLWDIDFTIMQGIVAAGVIDLRVRSITLDINRESIDLLQLCNIIILDVVDTLPNAQYILYMPKLRHLSIDGTIDQDDLEAISRTKLDTLSIPSVSRTIPDPLQYMPPTLKTLAGNKSLQRKYRRWNRSNDVEFILYDDNDE